MSANPAPFPFIAGDTLSLFGPVLDDGEPFSIAGWSATCKLRRDNGGEPGDLIENIDVSIVGGNSVGLFKGAADTAEWEPGLAWLDIRFVTPGSVTVTTPVVPIQIKQAASR
jgi:hypothetical protein